MATTGDGSRWLRVFDPDRQSWRAMMPPGLSGAATHVTAAPNGAIWVLLSGTLWLLTPTGPIPQ